MATCLAALDPRRLVAAHDEKPEDDSAVASLSPDRVMAAAATSLPEDKMQAGTVQFSPVEAVHQAMPVLEQQPGAEELVQAPPLSSKTACLVGYLQGCKVPQPCQACTLRCCC